MCEDTTPAALPVPPLVIELWRLLAAHRPAVRQARAFVRLDALVAGVPAGRDAADARGRPAHAGSA